jgi:hypothetical protein
MTGERRVDPALLQQLRRSSALDELEIARAQGIGLGCHSCLRTASQRPMLAVPEHRNVRVLRYYPPFTIDFISVSDFSV